MVQYIDAHCHVMDGAPHGARDADGYICNATRESEWNAVMSAAQNPCVHPAIGIHPWYVDGVTPGWDVRMADLVRAHSNIMIGEIGIDRARPDFPRQMEIFTCQMDIAVGFQRAVHVHVVRAWDVFLEFLGRYSLPPIIVLHGVRANADITRQLMRYDNIYYSFGRADVDAAGMVPENRILVESDGHVDVCLGNIVDGISKRRGMDMTDTIYNNTMRVINHG